MFEIGRTRGSGQIKSVSIFGKEVKVEKYSRIGFRLLINEGWVNVVIFKRGVAFRLNQFKKNK